MEEVEKISKVLQLVERYEDYLFRKAWGITLITIGVLAPLNGLLALRAQSIANILGMSAEAFISFASTIISVILMVVVIYSFTSATIVTSKRRKFSFRRDMPHAIAICLIWFIAFNLTRFVPECFAAASWLWAAGCASLLSYLILRKVPSHGSYPELLVIGLISLVASVPVAFVIDAVLAETASLMVFTVSFVLGGLYSMVTASKALSEGGT